MSRPPGNMYKMSEKLSEVMDDIGVNQKLVMKRRRAFSLRETLYKFRTPFFVKVISSFIFGSQIEGSTTIGLRSDLDRLLNEDCVNVIQHMREWKPESFFSLMMIQNENVSPGYCNLQEIRSDKPFPVLPNDIELIEKKVIDSEGRILWENAITSFNKPEYGPALKVQRLPVLELDLIPSYCCKSSPLQATPWLQKLSGSKWPSEEDKTFCRNAGCFVVSVGSKLSDMPTYEMRISTSLQERCLMFSLNITQLRCYVLMKMILKTHIHPYVKDVLSSFMCKNVLMYCVYNSSHESSQEWHTGNLLSYLQLCLFMLKECVLQRNCPHLMIPGNNLLAGCMTDTQRGQLLDIIDSLMEDKEELMYKIHIDDLGSRLKMKLNLLASSPELPSATYMALWISSSISYNIATDLSFNMKTLQEKMYNENSEVTQQNLSKLLSDLNKYRADGNSIQQSGCDLLIPLLKSALGSVMASISIKAQTAISVKAVTYLEAGRESDVLSGRLKLVSVLYSTGDIERAEHELKISLKQYNSSTVQTLCGCFRHEHVMDQLRFFTVSADQSEEAIKFLVAFCTTFLKNEINSVPHELRYEILKSYIEEDRKMRTLEDSSWMDLIAVDSVHYLYFLQFKTYGRLQRMTEELAALSNLAFCTIFEPNVSHKETSLNLLGQCCEQENLQAKAFQCYIWSLQHRERNNAARFLMCLQLFKLWKKYNA